MALLATEARHAAEGSPMSMRLQDLVQIAEFNRLPPGVRVSLRVSHRQFVVLALVDNSTDLAITGQPPESLDVVRQHIMDNPPVISVTHDHVLVALPVIPLTRMVEETLVVREPGSGTRASMERHFPSQRVDFQAGCEFGTNEALKQAVRAGLVLGAVSPEYIELELSTGCLVVLPVKGFPVVRQWYVLHRTHKRVSAAARTFREMLLGLEVPE